MIAPEKTKTNDEKYDKIEQYYSIKDTASCIAIVITAKLKDI